MKKNINSLLSLLFAITLVYLSGCSEPKAIIPFNATNTAPPTTSVLPTLTKTNTVIPAKTQIPTATKTVIKPTKTATGTPTFQAFSGAIQKCLSILSSQTEDQKLKGDLILITHPGKNRHSLRYNLENEKTESFQSEITIPVVSPDGKKYVFMDLNKQQLFLYSSDGIFLRAIQWSANWSWIVQWLDNSRIAIAWKIGIGDNPEDDIEPKVISVINPLTGQSLEFKPDYPGIDRSISLEWDGWSKTVYDPSLTRVVYYGHADQAGQDAILWDVSGNRMIAFVPVASSPKWFSDGSKFVFINNEDGILYSVSREGVIKQVTKSSIDFYDYSISPDNHYLAAWVHYSDDMLKTRLMIVDFSSGDIFDTCLPNGYNPYKLDGTQYPFGRLMERNFFLKQIITKVIIAVNWRF
jgi:hypothetical protein